jgi:polysaccharide pyruvyl transferase
MPRRTLVVGWFSFDMMGSTAGDVIARDVACGWLRQAGVDPDVAMWVPSGPREVFSDAIDPRDYDDVVFVCGPIGDGPPLNTFLDRFPHARKFALNVSLLQSREEWNPFAHIVERDSAVRTNPDITLAAGDLDVPLVGAIYVGPQAEYAGHQHDRAESMIRRVLAARDVAVMPICTRLDRNEFGLRTAAQIESAIARMDAVCSTRLHGAVLALRRGVPPVVVDSVPGGTKLLRQMARLNWPLAFDVASADEESVGRALDFALTPAARELARRTARAARAAIADVEREFLDAVRSAPAE